VTYLFLPHSFWMGTVTPSFLFFFFFFFFFSFFLSAKDKRACITNKLPVQLLSPRLKEFFDPMFVVNHVLVLSTAQPPPNGI